LTKAGNEGQGIYHGLGLPEDEVAEDVCRVADPTAALEVSLTERGA
jgi:hypothetical protein